MAFIKKVFSPGSSKDDEMMYGNQSSQQAGQQSTEASGPYTEGVPSGENAPTLHTDPATEGKEHGVLRQVTNPGERKYNNIAYGETASTDPSGISGASTEAAVPSTSQGQQDTSVLHTKPETEKKDHGILRQILNPDGKKYDEVKHGNDTATTEPIGSQAPTTAGGATALHSTPEAQKDSGISRQILGKKGDDISYGTTATAARDLPIQTTGSKPTSDTLDNPIDTSRIDLDPNTMSQRKYDDQTYDPTSTSTTAPGMAIPHQSPRPELLKDDQSTLSMKSGVLGPYAQQTDDRPPGNTTQDLPERSFPLGGGVATENARPTTGTSSVYSNDTSRELPVAPTSTSGAAAPTSTSEYIDPSTTNASSKDTGGLGVGSGSAAVAAAGTGAAASGLSAMEHEHKGHGHLLDDSLRGDAPQHTTRMGAILDPHVPGEFPSDDGLDRHQHGSSGLGAPSGMAGGGVSEVVNDRNAPTSTGIGQPEVYQPTGAERDHHYGRDAGIVGGLGAAGLGAHELSKSRDVPSTTQPSSSMPAQSSYETGSSSLPPTGATSSSRPEKESHLGRDAALAGGAGAAGYGAHEVINDRNAPSTTQPSSSVPAQSSYETGTSSIPPTSATASSRPDKEHHYGRDAALAGGAGAAGLGAHEVMNDRNAPSSTQPSSTISPQSSYETGTTSSIPPTAAASTSHPTSHDPYTYENLQDRSVPSSTTYPEATQQSKDHHYGKDAALAGGVGAAGYGAYEATHSDDRGDTGPASKTIGGHKSNLMNIIDPRVQPEPEKMKDHTTAGPFQSDSLNKIDPKVTSDPEKAREQGMGGHGYATFPPSQQQQTSQPQEGHHYGRDAALAGGAGAAGYGAYEATRGRNDHGLPGSETGPHSTGTANVLDSNVAAKPAAVEQREPLVEQQPEHHYGRDAALVGGAGAVGAGAYGAHEYNQRDAKQMEKEMEKERKEHDKELKHQQKEADKAHEKEAKHAEKEREKEAKHAEKEREKEREKHEKAIAHDREKAEKERAKEQEKAEKERAKEQERLEKAREREAEHAHSAKVAEVDGHNKLHKDPPSEEKKPSLIHRILHPHEKRETRDIGDAAEGERPKGLEYKDADEVRHMQNQEQLGNEGLGAGEGLSGTGTESSIVKDPHTGLPMDLSKTSMHGAGGTDGAEQIHGYEGQGTAMGDGATDWDAVKKANTPY